MDRRALMALCQDIPGVETRHERPLRVLHIISGIDPRFGGPAMAVAGLATAQAEAGLHVTVCAAWAAGDELSAAERLGQTGVTVQLVGPVVGRLRRHPEMNRLVQEQVGNAEVVHIHALWEEIQHQAARAAQRLGVPYIFRPCGMLDPWSLRQSRWQKRLYMWWRLRQDLECSAALHFTAQREAELAAPLQLKAPALIEPNGVDLSEFASPPTGAFRAHFGQVGNRPMVLFLSRLHPKKGLELLIPAFARVPSRDAMLVIAGPDSKGYQASLESLATEQGVGERTLFVGMLRGAERIAALADADLFVLPSYQENFGVAVVEALAAGTPVIISDQVNIYREIVEAQAGAAVPAAVEPLAEELSRWLGDEQLRISAAERAGPFVREHYDWKKIAQRWVGHYARITGRSASAVNASTERPT